MINYFFCYDQALARYLKVNGLDYVTRAKHYKTNREFTLFEVNSKLEKLIEEWKSKQVN